MVLIFFLKVHGMALAPSSSAARGSGNATHARGAATEDENFRCMLCKEFS
jgi:hypothetical protein